MYNTGVSKTVSNTELSKEFESSEYNDNLASRINHLREMLGTLREALQAERLNLRRDIQLTSWTICRDEEICTPEEIDINQKDVVPYPQGRPFKIQYNQGAGEFNCPFAYLNTETWNSSSRWKISDEIQGDPYPVDLNISWTAPTSSSNYYKQKIFDLEADCCAGLNKIRSKFMASLQSFEDTLDLSELYCDQKEFENQLDERILKTSQEDLERDADDLTCIYNTIGQTKSLIVNNVQNNSSRNVCSRRNSDSNICGVIFRSTQLQHEPTQIFALADGISDSTMSTLFESPDLSISQTNVD